MINAITKKESTSELLTPEEAADLLKVSKRTMYEWLRNGEIPSERIGERLIRVRKSDILSPDVRAYFEQGCKLGQNPETVNDAEVCFKKALQLNPRYAMAYSQLGFIFAYWGHSYRAITPLEKAVELNPSFYNYINLAHSYRKAQRYGKAESAYRNALEMRVIDLESRLIADFHFQLGFCIFMTALYQDDRMIEAIKQFRKSLEIDTHYKSAHFLGQAYLFHTYEYEKALLLADEIQESFPNESERIREMVELYKGSKSKIHSKQVDCQK